MSELTDRRRETLKAIVEKRGGVSKVAKQLGYSNPSFMSQMIGPNPTREITEKSARKFEDKLGLPPGTLDGEPPAQAEPTRAPATETASLVASVIRMVGRTLQDEGVAAGPDKFADVVALAYLDSVDHGGEPRETHVRQLARLLK